MDLPIDARRAPIRPKYLESETPMFNRWVVLGRNPHDATRFITDGTDDIIEGLTHQQAYDIVDAREVFVDTVLKIINGTK